MVGVSQVKCFLGFILLCFFVVSPIMAQQDTVQYEVGIQSVLSSGKTAPFWIHTGHYGHVPIEKNSLSVEIGVLKNYQHPNRLFDYSVGASAHVDGVGNSVHVDLHELFINTRLWIVNLNVGSRTKQHGNQDETLSSGGLLFSNNAEPIPTIFLGIEDFTPLIFKSGFLEVKGGLSHGWFMDDVYVQNMLFQHKYAYLRLGGKGMIRFQYGLDHAAQWGGNVPGYGQQPTSFKDFMNIMLLRSGSNSSIGFEQINMGGNHLISQSMRMDIRFGATEIGAYWQNINEDKPIRLMWRSVNVYDGLWGFSVKNKQFPIIKGILYEYLNTTDQNGPYHDKDGIVYGGADSYFNNYMYASGWTNYGRTIGTPFITSPIYNTDGSLQLVNTRVQAHHLGLEGEVSGYGFKVLNSYSKNYGNYSAPFKKDAVSLLIEVNRHFEKLWGMEASLSVGADWGQMYGRNTGLMLRLSKHGELFKY